MKLGTIIDLPKITDPRGNLTVVSEGVEIPFDIARAYWVYDVPGGECRGGHAHKTLLQFVVALSGSFTVNLDDGLGHKESYHLNHPYQGLLIHNRIWRTLEDFSSGAVCLVLASEPFDENEYIREYDDFVNYKQKSYFEWQDMQLPVTDEIARTELSLPCNQAMTEEEVSLVIDALNEFH